MLHSLQPYPGGSPWGVSMKAACAIERGGNGAGPRLRGHAPLLAGVLVTAFAGVVAVPALAQSDKGIPGGVDISAALAAPPGIVAQVDAGDFAGAEAAIAAALADPALDPDRRTALEFQRERMRRILMDFRLDEAAAKARLRRDIPDLGDEEFARWDQAGLIEARVIDGERRWFNRGPSNLFRISAEARERKATPLDFYDSPIQFAHPHHEEVREAALASGEQSVAPRRVRITQSLTVKPDVVPDGEILRAWLPFPRAIEGQQEDIELQATTPARHQLAPESALQRTVYMEAPARAGEPTEFSVRYELTIHAQYNDIDPARVVPAEITPELAPFVAERAPHVVFNDAMRLQSAAIVGDETNPYYVAKKLYDYVDSLPWAGAREYSTITNISQHALEQGHADCGQQTLLLITLLRLNGIPARWQSGWIFSEGSYNNMHDWGWLYLAPYGWVPMDVTFGRLHDAREELQDFYLGGLDALRVAFNDDYSRQFVPAKQHPRSETVDLQRGEVEWDGGNLYFDQWGYDFNWEILSPREPAAGS